MTLGLDAPRAAERAEVDERLGRVRAILEREDLDALLLTRRANVSWLLAGAEHVVVRNADPGLSWALVTAEQAWLLALDNEAAYLEREQRAVELGLELVLGPWWSTDLARIAADLVDPARTGNDGFGPGRDATLALTRERMNLTDRDRGRLRSLGADVCAVVEGCLTALDGAQLARLRGTELAGEIARGFERRGIQTAGLLIGGGERRARYRHPPVSAAPLGTDALVSVVGVRGGLHVALSRTVAAGADPALAARHAVACGVEAELIEATRPGRTWAQAFAAGAAAYAAGGHPDEWREHPQGGPIGYGCRELVALPAPPANHPAGWTIGGDEAFSWHPTVQGAKSEDTFLLVGGRAEAITNSDRWPTLDVPVAAGSMARPAILEL